MGQDDDQDCIEHVWLFEGATLAMDEHSTVLTYTCRRCGATAVREPAAVPFGPDASA